jgi:RimJ/RimL family protein N-acetyltransferase
LVEVVYSFLDGSKVLLRVAETEDAPLLQRWFGSSAVRRWLPLGPHPLSLKAERKLLSTNGAGATLLFVIVARDSMRDIGVAGLHEINYLFGTARTVTVIGEPTALHHGHGSEARSLVLQFAFNELCLQKVKGSTLVCNIAGRGVLERESYVLEGVKRREYRYARKWHDLLEYAYFANGRVTGIDFVPPKPSECSCNFLQGG